MQAEDFTTTPVGIAALLVSWTSFWCGYLLWNSVRAKLCVYFRKGRHRGKFPYPMPRGICTGIRFTLNGGRVWIRQGVTHDGSQIMAFDWPENYTPRELLGTVRGRPWVTLD